MNARKRSSALGGPIIDDRNYVVVSTGVRYGPMLLTEALAKAKAVFDEWCALGYPRGRKVEVFFQPTGAQVAASPCFHVQCGWSTEFGPDACVRAEHGAHGHIVHFVGSGIDTTAGMLMPCEFCGWLVPAGSVK